MASIDPSFQIYPVVIDFTVYISDFAKISRLIRFKAEANFHYFPESQQPLKIFLAIDPRIIIFTV